MTTNCEVENEADIESDGDNDDDDDDDNQEKTPEDVKLQGLAGMGDVIGKILAKPIDTNNTNIILCKSRKSKKRKLDAKQEHIARKEKEQKLVESRELNHVVPTRGNAQKEVLLKRIATKGVVKLLNAVSQHQKNVSEKMKEERTEAGKDKVESKVAKPSNFMELLKKKRPEEVKKKKTKSVVGKDEIKEEEDEDEDGDTKKWKVLREDFMIGSSMKDWDKIESGKEDDDDDDGDDDDSSSEDDKG